ncbi:MAG: NADH-quinone oxidoreductase subunit N [Alphaproteobacteria bacterium]
MLSLGVAAFAGHYERVKLLPNYVLVPIVGVIIFMLFNGSNSGLVFDKELLVIDGITQFAKTLIALLLMGALIVSSIRIFKSDRHFNPHRTEYFTTLLIASFGMMIMVSANDLITFYMGLEIQSLALYILIAYRRADAMASEAALKYLILGAVGSGLFLYGTSLLFGVTGSVSYEALHSFAFMSGDNLIYLIGLTLVLTALFFKLSAAPFHMWTPDVYQGAPIFVTTFVATAPKVAAVFGLLRMVGYAFQPVSSNFQSVLIVASILSLVIGAVMAVRQTSLLRLAAYSTITHMGYVLLGIASNVNVANFTIAEYMLVYSLTSFGLFTFIGSIRLNGKPLNAIHDLSGLSKLNAGSAIILTILMLSLAGIPPLAGFFVKFSVLKSAVSADLVWVCVIAVLASAVSAFYYLRVIKIIYFDEPILENTLSIDKTHYVLAMIIAVFLVAYVFYPNVSSDIFAHYIRHYGYNI